MSETPVVRLCFAALVASALLSSGCYVQLAAGLYSVHGGRGIGMPTPPELSPSFGVNAGFAYDPGVRIMAGAGTQSVNLPQNEHRAVALTGPAHAQFDLPFARAPSTRFELLGRVGIGGTMQFGSIAAVNPSNSVLEMRPYYVAHGYLPLTLDLIVGARSSGFFSAGLSIAPGMFVGVNNQQSTLWGFGGDLRLTLAVPIPAGQLGPALGHIFTVRLTPQQEAEWEALHEQLPSILARINSQNAQQSRQQDMQQHQQYLRLDCIRRGDRNC
jgi:hypothetical protein